MLIRSSLLILLLLTSTAFGDAVVTVNRMVADSSTATLNNIGIPRWQGAASTKRGQFIWYASPGGTSSAYPVSNVKFMIGTGLQTIPSWSRFTATGYGTNAMDHLHMHSYKDTFYASYFSDRLGRAYFMDTTTNTFSQLFTWPLEYSTTVDQYAVATYPLPGTDSVVRISRGTGPTGTGTEVAHPTNILGWYSTDNGQTWGGMDTVRDWTAYEGRKRMGLFPYGSSVGFVGDSGDVAIVIGTYQRGTRTWTDHGAAITTSSNIFRSFSANTVVIGANTYIVAAMVVSDRNAAGDDSLLTAYKNITGGGSWTRLPDILISTGTSGTSSLPNYVQFELIENSNRLVMFYARNMNGGAVYNENFDVACRYLKTDLTWSEEYTISNEVARGTQSYKFVTCPTVPTNHGDVAYVGYVVTEGGFNKAKMAVVEFTEQTVINITSLPYTIATSSRTYTINGAKLSSATNGITLATGVHDVIIDGQGDTIVFGTGGTTVGSNYTLVDPDDGDRGIIIGAQCYNVTIRDLVVKHDPPTNIRNDSTLISNACAVRWAAGGRTHDILIERCHFSIAPVRNAWIMQINNSNGTVGVGAHYNNLVRNCTWADSCNAFARRDYWIEQASIVLEQFNYGISAVPVAARGNFQYHMKFEACSTITAFWANLYIEGDSSIVVVENNAWKTDGWNRLSGTAYDVQMQTARGGFDAVNCTENYNIAIKEYGAIADGARVKVINNRLYAGNDKAGGRGIFLSNADGLVSYNPDSCIYIAGNTIDVHQGEDGAGDNCMGIILRQGYNYIYVRDNTIRVTGDANSGTSAYGQMLVPLRLTTAPTAGHIKVIKNTIISYFNGTAPTQNWYPTGTVIGSWGIMFDEADNSKTDWTIDSNTTEVQGVHLQYGWYNGPGGQTRVTNHTFGYYPGGGNSPNDATTYVTNQDYTPPSASYGSTYITHSLGNEIVDPIFTDGITDNRFRWGSTASFPQSSAKLSVTAAIRVVDSSGNPVENATVTVTNAYGTVDTTGTTGPNGYFRPELPYWYEENVAAGNNDSTAFVPYTISVVTPSAATASGQIALDWDNKAITLIAGASSGEARPITHIGGYIRFSGQVRIDNADVPDLNDPGGPVGD